MPRQIRHILLNQAHHHDLHALQTQNRMHPIRRPSTKTSPSPSPSTVATPGPMQSYHRTYTYPPSTHSPQAICQSLERWSSWTQQDIEADKTIVDTVNALVVVAAFIAGVQSSIISFTIQLPIQSPLARAANVSAFVGLLLDVIGTFLGVIHAIVLQRRIKQNTTLLAAMSEISHSLRAIHRILSATPTPTTTAADKDKDKLEPSTQEDQLRELGISDPQQQLRRAEQLHNVLEGRFKGRSVSGPFAVALGVLHAVIFPTLGRERVEMVIKSLFALGHTPLFAMGAGVVALVLSIILLAAGSTDLRTEVWVSCVVTLGGVIGFSLMPITYESLKKYFFPSMLPEA